MQYGTGINVHTRIGTVVRKGCRIHCAQIRKPTKLGKGLRWRVRGAFVGGGEHGRSGRDSADQPKALGQDKFEHGGVNRKSWRGIISSEYDAEIGALAIPALLGSLMIPISSSVDAAVVGRIGLAQLSGVGVAGLFWLVSLMMFGFLGILPVADAAEAKEQGDNAQLSRTAAQVITLSVLLGVGLGAALFFNTESIMMHVIKPKPEVLPFATIYLKTVAIATPATLTTIALAGLFRGLQNTKALLASSLISCSSNVLMDIIFVLGFGWGVGGAAAATVLSQYFAPIFLLRILTSSRQLKTADFLKPLNLAFVLPFLSRGAVIATRSFLMLGNFMLCSILLGRLGVTESGAFEVSRMLLILGTTSYTTLDMCAQALCGKYFGRNDPRNARGVLVRLLQVGWVTTSATAIIACTFCRPLVSLFTNNTLVADKVVALSPILFFSLIICGSSSILDGALMASRQSNFASLTMMLSSSLAMLGAVFIFNIGSLTTAYAWMLLQFGQYGRLVLSFPKIFYSKSSPYKLTS